MYKFYVYIYVYLETNLTKVFLILCTFGKQVLWKLGEFRVAKSYPEIPLLLVGMVYFITLLCSAFFIVSAATLLFLDSPHYIVGLSSLLGVDPRGPGR